jgi:glucose/arabinose dehydrogenase
MNKKQAIFLSFLALIVISILGFVLFKINIKNINIPNSDIPEISKGEVVKGEIVPFLSVPKGFEITYYAKNIPGARVLEFDPKGRMLVSQTKKGTISVISDKNYDGVAEDVQTLISDLKSPHGMAFDCRVMNQPCDLYVATHDALLKYVYNENIPSVSGKEKLLDLPYSITDRHTTRTIMFLGYPDDDQLLISIGSSCNVCYEKDNARGKIISYNVKTKEVKDYATGLRNAVFMTLNPINGLVFVTEMGRDGLGDDIPPDEINIIDLNIGVQNFGWPICYGKNIHDTEFDKNTYIRNPCMDPLETPSWFDIQAHSAPLGISFIPEEGWPEDHWFDILVSYHGSWNRSVPVGYKIARIGVNGKGQAINKDDFITGWISPTGEKFGRPVDIKILSGGTAFITDDLAGVIYKLQVTN